MHSQRPGNSLLGGGGGLLQFVSSAGVCVHEVFKGDCIELLRQAGECMCVFVAADRVEIGLPRLFFFVNHRPC